MMKPCIKCGSSERNKWGHCSECDRVGSRKRYSEKKNNKLPKPIGVMVSLVAKPCIKCGSTDRTKRGDCKDCSKAIQKAWYQSNKKYMSEYKKTWLLEHPSRSKEFDLQVRVKRYGLSVESFQQMYISQEGLCAICGRDLGRTDIDHDHTSGVVRGLLCHTCNIGLGAFQDNPDILSRAIQYLISSSPEQQVKVTTEGAVCTTTCCLP